MTTTATALSIQLQDYDSVRNAIQNESREGAFEKMLDYVENYGYSARLMKLFALKFGSFKTI